MGEKSFRDQFIESMSVIGGKSGSKNGTKVAYLLLDKIFIRQFLTKISWTGCSRQKDVKKISFLKYKYCIESILKIINLADNRFTNEDLNSFFKRVLKNANLRTIQKKANKEKPKNITEINRESDDEDSE